MAGIDEVFKEVSEAVAAIQAALADGKLTLAEAREIIQQGAEALLALSTALGWWLGLQSKLKTLGGGK